MGGTVSKEGLRAIVRVDPTKTKLINKDKAPITVKVFKRTRTFEEGNEVETLFAEHDLDPGGHISCDNDYDITDQLKIKENKGVDYRIRIYPRGNEGGWHPEEFQIVYDGTYQYFPNVRWISGPRKIAVGSTGFAARVKALRHEAREIHAALESEGEQTPKTRARFDRNEECKMDLLEELQEAIGEGCLEFHDALEFLEVEGQDECPAAEGPQSLGGFLAEATSPLVRTPDEWWNVADLLKMGLRVTSHLKDTRIFSRPWQSPAPWCQGESESLYEEMGMRDSEKIYIAVWMLLGSAAILTVSEALDREHLQRVLQDGERACLEHRLKLVMDPVHVGESCRSILPVSATDPKHACFVKKFLGERGSSLNRSRTAAGVEHVCLMIDFDCAGRLTSWALKNVGFRKGHVLDLHVVDWPEVAFFTSGRLKVSEEVMRHLRGPGHSGQS